MKRCRYFLDLIKKGIRIIKYMSWEPQFIKKIQLARESELTSRLHGLFGYMGLIVISWGSSILVTFTSFFFYTVRFFLRMIQPIV